jgi:hypothetical protein
MDTNNPTMMELFSPPAAWFCWQSIHTALARDPLRKGLAEVAVKVFYKNKSTKGGNILLLLPICQ